jgi:hypothetical protein
MGSHAGRRPRRGPFVDRYSPFLIDELTFTRGELLAVRAVADETVVRSAAHGSKNLRRPSHRRS